MVRGRIPPVPATVTTEKPKTEKPKLPAVVPLEWPDDQPILQSREMAYEALFKQWGLSYTPAKDGLACDFAETHGLRCLHHRGSLGSLRRLNRPAVLVLNDERGQAFFALLTALGRNTARFVLGGERRTVAIQDLEARWRGEFSILWRVPPGYQGTLRQGDQGPEVAWLSGQLAAVRGQAVSDRPVTVLDGPLFDRLREFQAAKGLTPDGVVGPHTLINLNTALDQGVPLLQAKREGS
jgi:general secretion pathway protein A